MANTIKPAGYVNVKNVIVTSFASPNRQVDFVTNYTSITFEESIHSPYVQGKISVVDPYGMIYKSIESKNTPSAFPYIHGEEYLTIRYEDDVSEDVHEEEYFIYAVTDIKLLDGTKETALTYTLNFASVPKVFSDTYIIRKAYRRMKISDMVRDIYDEYYVQNNPGREKPIEIEETTGEQTYVIPALTPEQTIMFLARRAYSQKSKSSLFYFFETREKFYFYTHEGFKRLFDEKSKTWAGERYNYFEYYNGPEDNSVTGQERARTIVSNAKMAEFNSMATIRNTSYQKTVSEIDLLNRSIRPYIFRYKDNYSNFNNIDNIRLSNSDSFIDATSRESYTRSFIIKDYNNINETRADKDANHDREYPYYVEKHTHAPVFAYHVNANKMTGDITGRKSLFPGDFIRLRIPEFAVTSMTAQSYAEDIDHSDTHLLTSLIHYIEGNKWLTRIEFSKGGKGGGAESQPDAPSTIIAGSEIRPGERDRTPVEAGQTASRTPDVTDPGGRGGGLETQLPNSLQNDAAFQAQLDKMMEKYPGLNRQDLYRVMKGESNFNPRAVNADSGATGLFQFIPSTAQTLGTTTEQIKNMTPVEQLQLYDKYLETFDYRGGPLGIMQAAPGYAGRAQSTIVYPVGSKAWTQNPGWRPPGGGNITVASINDYYNKQGTS